MQLTSGQKARLIVPITHTSTITVFGIASHVKSVECWLMAVLIFLKCCFINILDKGLCNIDKGICSGMGTCVGLYGGYNCIKNLGISPSTVVEEDDDICTYYVLSTTYMPFN